MKIIDISPETEADFFCCLEEWSDDMKEAGHYKEKWYRQMREKGLKVKFAVDDDGKTGGMIQYLPIEHSIFEGENLNVVLCIWVHGHKKGRGDYRRRGMGKALLQAAEDDSRVAGANGLVTWGLILPVFMQASWFKRKGYRVADKSGIIRLLWKPFNDRAVPPKLIKPRKKPGRSQDKVNLTLFRTGWCQSMNITCERAIKASAEFPEKIELKVIDTLDRKAVTEWGISDAVYINGREIRTGPPLSYEKIRKKIYKSVKQLKN